MAGTDRVLMYVTTSGEEEAARIARTLVEERLVACANILPPVRSFYWWEGELQDDREVVFVAKTTAGLVPRDIQRVKELHSYQVPAILALPILEGNAVFLQWVRQECRA